MKQKKKKITINWYNSQSTRKNKKQKIDVINALKDFTKDEFINDESDNHVNYILKKCDTRNRPLLNWNEQEILKKNIWECIINYNHFKDIYYDKIINYFLIHFNVRDKNSLKELNKPRVDNNEPFDFGFINTVVDYLSTK